MAVEGRWAVGGIVILSSLALAMGGLGCRERASGATAWAAIEPDAGQASDVAFVDIGGPTATAMDALPEPGGPTPWEPREPPRPGPLTWVTGVAADGAPIGYEVLEPADAGPETPLVIALHGMGDSPRGFARFVKKLSVRARVFIGRGPLTYVYGGRQWYDNDADDAIKQVRQRAKDLTVLATQVESLYPRAGKPALVGFSQGAAVALQAALEFPDRWRAVVGLSGFIASETGAVAPSSRYPVLVVAGTEDAIVPAVRSWSAAGALVRYGHKDVRKLEFEGEHEVPKDVVVAVKNLFEEVFATQ